MVTSSHHTQHLPQSQEQKCCRPNHCPCAQPTLISQADASCLLHRLPSLHRDGVVWAGGAGGGCAAELLLTFQDAIVCLSGFAASLGPQQSVLLSSHIYIDPPPSTASLLPLSILLPHITWEERLWKWQIRAAAGEAVWQGRKGLSAATLGGYHSAKLVAFSLSHSPWGGGSLVKHSRQEGIVDRDPAAPQVALPLARAQTAFNWHWHLESSKWNSSFLTTVSVPLSAGALKGNRSRVPWCVGDIFGNLVPCQTGLPSTRTCLCFAISVRCKAGPQVK